jgi:hypothetical protein
MRIDLWQRLADERGMALVMALGIAMVLTILGSALVLYSSSNDKQASRSAAMEKLYHSNQAGVDSAVAQLAQGGAAAFTNPAFFSSMPAASKASDVDGIVVAWTGDLCDDRQATPCPFVAAGKPATYIPRLRWHLRALATARSPAAIANLQRTVSADVRLNPKVTQTSFSDAWRYVYSRQNDGNPITCDQTIRNNPAIVSSFYVTGDLCLENSASFLGPPNPATDPPVDLVAKGNVYLNHPSTSVGTSSRPVNKVFVEAGKGCKFRSNPSHNPCTSVDRVYVHGSPYGAGQSQTGGPVIPPPATDWNEWYYASSPGPTQPCDPALSSGAYTSVFFDNNAGKDRSLGTFNLAGMPAFSCKTGAGELSWTPGSPGQLRVVGTVFFDGAVDFNGPLSIDYQGMGALYTSGSIRLRQAKICAAFSGSNCAPNECPAAGGCWDTQNDVLVLVAEGNGAPAASGAGITLEQSSSFQGALFATADMTFENNTDVHGPMVAEEEIIQNSMTFHLLPWLVKVPFGMPGVTTVEYELTPPTNYAG